jgi:hypothetical protein
MLMSVLQPLPALLQAHSLLQRTVPTEGAVVTQPPPEIRLWFTEPIERRFSKIEVWRARPDAATGKPRPQERLDKGWVAGPAISREVAVRLPLTLMPGLYVIQWQVLSIDSHRSTGSFTITYTPETLPPSGQK